MKIKVDVNINHFQVPNYVTVRKEAGSDIPQESHPLSSLDSSTLVKLCEAFTDNVFKKAGKERPPQEAT